MAWNEPGGSGDKDPWGGGKKDQGPPDLDEALRKLQNKLGSVFGRGRGGGEGGSSRPSGVGAGGVLGIIFLLALVWGGSGFYIIEEGYRGVVLQFGAYTKTTEPGWHWYPRFVQTVNKVNVDAVQSIEIGNTRDEAIMLTQDENIIDIKFVVQYRISDPNFYLFAVRDPDETLKQVTESVLREIIGKSKMDFIITTGRGEVVIRAKSMIQQTLDDYQTGLQVLDLAMQDAQPPQQVQEAFFDAVRAREDQQRKREEAEAYANDVLPKARGDAKVIEEEAQAYFARVVAEAEGEASRFTHVLAEYRKAPEVTRQRLYLDAMEGVLQESSKVIVDVDGGNQLLYLPLDRMMGAGAVAPALPATAGGDGSELPKGYLSGNQGRSALPADSQRMRDPRSSDRSREVR